jgi:predicted nucleic acid-binding protein
MKTLLDTCVLSELVTKQPNPQVVDFVDGLDPDDTYLGVIKVGEIVKGIEKLPNSQRRKELHAWLKEDLLARFQGKIIPIDEEVMVGWGILTARAEAAGKPMPAIDSLIAATAQAHGLALVTRNGQDFIASGVEIVNPWEE